MPAWERRHRRWKPKPYRARYAQAHRAKRKALTPVVAAGLAKCARCHEPILPGWIRDTDLTMNGAVIDDLPRCRLVARW